MGYLIRRIGCVAICLAAASCARAEEQSLFDFEQGALGDAWSASGKIGAKRIASPAPSDGDARGTPRGQALEIATAGGAGLFARAGQVKLKWPDVEAISVWVYRSPAEARARPQSTVELQFYEADGKARFWRKVDVAHVGWQRYDVPLKWLRWGDGRIPDWRHVDRFGFYFRDGATLAIDNIAAETSAADSAYFSAEDLQQLAFAADAKVQVAPADGLMLLTDVRSFDADALLAHFGKVSDDVLKTFSLPRPIRAIPILVFNNENDYRDFPVKLGQKQNAAAARPTSGGYAVCGIATSFWDPRQGTLRPVFTHEFVHALLSHAAQLDNRGDWLQEGAATYFQMKYHRQKDLNQIVAQGIADRTAHLPLDELASGQRIPQNRYWQAMTLVELLITDEALAKQHPALMAEVSKTGNTDLRTHIEPIFHSNWPALTTRWRKHCERAYRVR